MAITTLSEYKTFAGISGTGDDTALAVMLTVAQDMAERHCNRLFDSSSRTQVYDGRGTKILQVNAYPVTAVSSIWVTDAEGDTVWTLDTTEYKYEAASGIFTLTPKFGSGIDFPDYPWYMSSSFPNDAQNVNITYTGGYTSAPDTLKWAIWSIVNWLFATRRADPHVVSESIGSYSVTFANDTGVFASGGPLGRVGLVLSQFVRGMS